MFLLIDNYDSFTYNLVQAFAELGRTPLVMTNDDPELLTLATAKELTMVCISPGPSTPERAGYCLEFLEKLPVTVPVLGVCLGHQVLGAYAGATVRVGPTIMHGKQSAVYHDGTGLFSGITSPMIVGRYHSLLVTGEGSRHPFAVPAQTEEGEIMCLQYTDRPWVGVQFHPESILTPEGMRLLANFPSALLVTKNGELTGENATAVKRQMPIHRPPLQMATILDSLAQGKDLTDEEAAEAFTRLMEGELSPAQAGAFLLCLRAKGETPEEVNEAVRAVLAKAVPVAPVSGVAIDIVGTGGDSKGSFNCSTAVSLTLAGMGYRVLKHGNRSASSRCGSADVLELLGIPLDTQPEQVEDKLNKDKFVFLFAPRYHPSFKHVAPVRRELGVRNLFNIIGPLVNPARPSHFLIGVADPTQVSLVAETLARSGSHTGIVVSGAGGYDEATTLGEADLVFVYNGKVRPARLDPAEYGFKPYDEEELKIRDPEHAAEVLRELLEGKGPEAMREMLAVNVGLAVYLLQGGLADEKIDADAGYDRKRMKQAMLAAKEAVASGAGRRFCYAGTV